MYKGKQLGLGIVVAVLSMAASAEAVGAATYPDADGLGPFVDVDGSIHEADVAALWAGGVTSGCGGQWLFCPEEAVTRGEMAAFLSRGLGLEVGAESAFTDVAHSPFASEIEAIYAAGLTDGCGPDTYCPGDEVTRGQMASFLARALDLPVVSDHPFVDVAGSLYEADIARIAAVSITRGCEEDRFCPHDPVTRQEMASFLARALELSPPQTLPEIPDDVIEEYLDELQGPPWPTGPGAEGWRPLVEEHFRPGDVDRAIRVMACESLGDPWARNPRSGASGLFQHMPRYWPERSTAAGFGGESIFDPVANVAVAAWLIYDYPAGGWRHWVCKG